MKQGYSGSWSSQGQSHQDSVGKNAEETASKGKVWYVVESIMLAMVPLYRARRLMLWL